MTDKNTKTNTKNEGTLCHDKTDTLIQMIQQTLEHYKAQDIRVLNVQPLCDFTDYMVLCTANSQIHAHNLLDHLVQALKKAQHPPIGVEGKTHREWILIDLGHIIIHIMLKSVRAFYQLENLWCTKNS